MLCRAAQFVKPEGGCESLASPRKRERERVREEERELRVRSNQAWRPEGRRVQRRKARPTDRAASASSIVIAHGGRNKLNSPRVRS
jgi:hypothetical protein